MDVLTNSLFSEEGLDGSIFVDKQHDFINPINEEFAAFLEADVSNILFQTSNSSSSSESLIDDFPRSSCSITSFCTESPPVAIKPPVKWRKTNLDPVSPSVPIILNFGDTNSPENLQLANSRPVISSEDEAAGFDSLASRGSDPSKRMKRVKPASEIYDHTVAERKRRAQLNQRFATLSGMIPDLKKMDKTSILMDAINYLDHLKDQVKTLEERATTRTIESLVLVKKKQIMDEDINVSSDENKDFSREQPLPEIDARLCKNHILLRIQCEKIKGVLVKLFDQVEKLNLTVISSNVQPFGNLALDITIVAEKEKESSLLLKEIVKVLHFALQRTA